MGNNEGAHGGEAAAADFEEVEERHAEVEFEEFSEEVALAFPEDTVAYEELFDEDPTASAGQSDESPAGDEEASADGHSEQYASSESRPSEHGDSILEQLAAELEDVHASDQAIEKLREELGVTSPQNVEVRLRHLQTQVSDLTAYIDALEAFLDDRGSAKQVLESVESELESIDARLEDLERAHDADHDQLRDRIAVLEEELDEQAKLSGNLEAIQDRVDTLEVQLEATDEAVDTTTERIDTLEGDVSSALTTLEQRQAKLQEELEAVQQTHRKLAKAFGKPSTD